jgi:hypothetical protein
LEKTESHAADGVSRKILGKKAFEKSFDRAELNAETD